jgi:peptidoglycan hydrolase-like protein with peptidoglycan-binding domain/TPR repeat protein
VSRSYLAWTKGRAFVGAAMVAAGRLGRNRVQARLRIDGVAHTSSSFIRLTWVATVVMLTLTLSPANALGQVGGPHRRASVASATREVSQRRAATHSTSPNPDPPHIRGASAQDRSSRADVLTLGTGYGAVNGSKAVRALQRRLINLGYSPGPVDGRYGPLTERAVIGFQAAHGVRVDGIAGPLTSAALRSATPVLYPGVGYTAGGSQPVRKLQRELMAAGFAPGPIDGRYGPLTERAVARYQAARHLRVDGIAGPRTLGRLQATPHRAPHKPQRLSSQRRGTHHPARPTTRRSNGTPSQTASAPKTHQRRSSTPTIPIAWIIAFGCVLAALLAAVLWHRLSPRADNRPVTGRQPRRRPTVPQFRRAVRARREVLDTVPSEVEPRERATELRNGRPGESNEDQEAGAAAFRLGLLLAQDGNLVGAEDAFRRADDRGHPAAPFELGVLLAQEGDRAGAVEAFRRADDRGHSTAAFNLGVVLAEEGDRAGAKEAFRRADERGHPDAAFDVGVLLFEDGDLAGAEDAFRRADQRGDAGAACNLGVLLERRGDKAAAKEAYRRADSRGVPTGSCNLGALLESEGDVAGAKDAYLRADAGGDPMGSYHLGRLLEQQGDRDGAKDAYRRSDQRGNPEAACNLGFMLKQEGDRDGALQAFRRAGEQGSGEVADVAHAELLELAGTEEGER